MFHQFALLDLSTPDLVIILLIVLLLFGSKKLPQLTKSLGESMRELRKGFDGNEEKTKNKDEQRKSDTE